MATNKRLGIQLEAQFQIDKQKLEANLRDIEKKQKVKIEAQIDTSRLKDINNAFNNVEKERLNTTTNIQRQIESMVVSSNKTIAQLSAQTSKASAKEYETFWIQSLKNVDMQKQLDSFRNTQLNKVRIVDNRYGGVKGTSQELQNYVNNLKAVTVENGKLINSNTKAGTSFKELRSGLTSISTQARANIGFFDKLRDNAQKFASYFFIGGGIVTGINAIKNGLKTINELNKSLTDIRIVTGQTASEVSNLGQQYNQLAKDVGATTQQVLSGATEWYRQGKSNAEAQELVKASIVESKLAAIDSAQATEYLTSVLNGFQMKSSEVTSVIDKMVAIDNSAATSVAELSEALQRSSNSASQAGVTFDELLSYVGTVSSVTRKSAESIGQSFSTMFTRLQEVKIGGNDGFLEDGTGVADVEKVLGQVGVRLKENETTFRDMGDVLTDLAGKWNTLNEVEQASVAKVIAGTRNRENFLVLMNNFDKALEMQGVSANSAGLAMDRYGIYLESTEAKVNKFKATLEGFWTKSMDSKTIQGFIELGTSIIDLFDKIGGLTTILTMLTGGIILKNITGVAGLLTSIGKTVNNVTAFTQLLGTEGRRAFSVLELGAFKAKTATESLVSVLGIATIAITALVMWHNYQKEKVEELNRTIDENVQKTNEEIKSIDGLTTQYDDLRFKLGTNKDARNQLLKIQDDIIKTLGLEKDAIDLVNGSYEDNIKVINQAKLAKLQEAETDLKIKIANEETELNKKDKPAMSDGKEYFLFSSKLKQDREKTEEEKAKIIKIIDDINKEFGKDTANTTKFKSGIQDSLRIELSGDSVSEKLKIMKMAIDELTNSGMTQSQMFIDLSSRYDELKSASGNLIATQEQLYNNMAQQKVIDIADKLGIKDISNISKEQFDKVKQEFDSLMSGMTDKAQIEGVTEAFNNMIGEILPQYASGMSEDAQAVEELSKRTEELGDITDATVSDIELLKSATDKLTEGQELTGTEINKLIARYPELQNELVKTENGYKINEEALISLKNQSVDSFNQMIDGQIQTTQATITQINTRITGYQQELEEMKKLAKGMILLNSLQDTNKRMMGFGDITTENVSKERIKSTEDMINNSRKDLQSALDSLNSLNVNKTKVNVVSSGGVGDNKKKKGGGKDKSGSEKYAEYMEKGLDDAIKVIENKGSKLTKQLELLDTKIEQATTKGDEKLRQKLENEKSQLLDKQLKNVQESSLKLFQLKEKWAKELAKANIPELKNVNLKNITEEQLNEIQRLYDKKIDEADRKNNNKLKASLQYSKEMVGEFGKSIIAVNSKISELGHSYLEQQAINLQNAIDKINVAYDKMNDKIQDGNADIELQQILLNEDGEAYAKLQEKKYQNAIKARENADKAIQELRKKGLSDDSEEIQKYIDLHRDAENTRLSLLKQMEDKRREMERESLEKTRDKYVDLVDKIVDVLKKEYEQQKKNIELQKQGYKDIIDARKEALDLEKESHDYQKGLAEKQKALKDVQDKLNAMQFDDKNLAQKKLLQEEEKKLADELNEYQYDKRIDTQKDALDDEYKAFEKQKDAEIKVIDDILSKEGLLRQKAIKAIEENNREMYDKLIEYNRIYGTGVSDDISSAWALAQEAIEKYGTSQLSVLETLDKMIEKTKELADTSDYDYGERGQIVGVPERESNTSSSDKGGSSSKPKMSEKEAKIKEQANQAKYYHRLAADAKGDKAKLAYLEKERAKWGIDKWGGIKEVGKVPSEIWSERKKVYGFNEGGEQNFTGLAMLHGTPNKPERILSAEQTESFNKLANYTPNLTSLLDRIIGNVPSMERNTGKDMPNISIEKLISVDKIDNGTDMKTLVSKARDAVMEQFGGNLLMNGMPQKLRVN